MTTPDGILAALPLIEAFNHPQPEPQEYDCGCVAVLRITDADYRDRGKPFEMRLAIPCGTDHCDVVRERTEHELERSRGKNADGAMLLLGMALFTGDKLREQLARAILRECGYPGGEDASSINEAAAAIAADWERVR